MNKKEMLDDYMEECKSYINNTDFEYDLSYYVDLQDKLIESGFTYVELEFLYEIINIQIKSLNVFDKELALKTLQTLFNKEKL